MTKDEKKKKKKSEVTREKILSRALALFRRRGYGKVTMRDVARAAGVALGAAYYYFPSKEAIVLAYYEATQSEHGRLARAAMADAIDPRERVGIVMHTKLDLLARDRKLLGAIFRSVADPDDRISIFGEASREVRDDSIRLFDEAMAAQGLDARTRSLVAHALWSLHMGVLLYFLHDRSPQQQETRALADGALDLAMQLVALAPVLGEGLLDPLARVLEEAGLLVAIPPSSGSARA